MKPLKVIALALVAIVGTFALLGVMMPRDMKAERSVVIERPRAAVFAHITNVETWPRWILGATLDPRCAFRTTSNALTWDCEGALGSLTLVDRDADQGLWIDASLPGAIEQAKMRIAIADERGGAATKITWTEEARAPGLVGGWLTPLFRRMRGEQIELALRTLSTELAPKP